MPFAVTQSITATPDEQYAALEAAAEAFMVGVPFKRGDRTRITSTNIVSSMGLVSDLAVVLSARAAPFGDVEVVVISASGAEAVVSVQRDQLEAVS